MTRLGDPVSRGIGTGERSGTASAFGTFGELLQGALPDGLDFLVTMPIARWSTASFHHDPGARDVTVRPQHKSKALALVRAMLTRSGRGGGGLLLLDGDLPEGKGLASSSADLVATARATGLALGGVPTPEAIEDLMRGIEPSDGVMYPGVVAFHHREVRLRARLGHLPPMVVVGVDEGGEVETVGFNRQPKHFTTASMRTYERLLATLTDAVAAGDVDLIGEVATRSALMNQRLCRKRFLDEMIEVCRAVGGLGVVAAHSGTALGVLLAADDPAYPDRLDRTRRACAALSDSVWVDRCLPGNGVPGETGYQPEAAHPFPAPL